MGPPRILFRPGTEELQATRAGLSEPPFLQVFMASSCQWPGFPWRHHGHRYPFPPPVLALSWTCHYSYAPTPSLSLHLFLALEEIASIEEADREKVPAVALQVVTQDCTTSSISSVEGQSANEATEKEEWPMEKPGLGWRRVDGVVC